MTQAAEQVVSRQMSLCDAASTYLVPGTREMGRQGGNCPYW